MALRLSFFGLLGILISITSVQGEEIAESKDPEQTWRAGVARTVIRPPEYMWMAGYAARERPAEGMMHDLWAKALALEDAKGNLVLLITTDIIGFSRDLSVLILLVWHALCIVDANVDAHLMTWNVSDDLSLRMNPVVFEGHKRFSGFGLNMSFVLK